MKQNRNRLIFTPLAAVVLLVAGSLAGCTKSDLSLDNRDRMEIAPLVTVGGSSAEAVLAYGSSAQSRAAASGNQALGLYFARADETSASAYNTYGATAITATRTAGAGEQPLSFDPAQYYLGDGLKTKLTGWYPGGTHDGTAHTVSWTIDGQQDIMTAPAQQGSRTSAMPAMTFDHRLTQLQFYPYAQTQSAIDAWGKITKIEVLNQQNTVVYDLADDATGVVSFSGDKTNNFSAGIAAGGAALSLSTTANRATDAKQMGNAVMIAPQSAANHVLTLRVTTSQNMYKDVTLTQALTAGVPYRLYMDFKQLDIIIETTVVADWRDVATSDNIGGEMRIGDYMDGGLVFYIDPANPQKYKVMSLDEGSGLKWSAQNFYMPGDNAQNTTDGKANVATMKTYATTNGLTFADAFPAANFCDSKNTGGVTGWYLPAKDELKALYTAYTANQPAINAGLSSNGGTIPPSGEIWSSTENSSNTSNVWCVDFSDGNPGNNAKSYGSTVRCVRDIAPPPPVVGDFKDGGIVYEVTDATKYKVMSLDQGSSLVWSAQNTYAIGANAQSTTDGKANSAAIKSYFATNTATVGLNFSVAFPAANFCDKKNTGGVTGWYLPAKDEFTALYTAYKIHKTAIDAGLSNGGTTIPPSGDFWSSTEISSNANTVWIISFYGGSNYDFYKNNGCYVRCIRDIAPPPAVGDFKDGGIVYEVTDATKYKVMSLDEGSKLKWSAQSDYIIGTNAQSTTDGKANSAAIKNYFAANTATVGSDFSAAFPAANFCDSKNTGDVTGWYLPASGELMALYTAYTANKSAIDKGLIDKSGTAITASGYFWSSTEGNSSTSNAWYVYFTGGDMYDGGKGNTISVRCIRDI